MDLETTTIDGLARALAGAGSRRSLLGLAAGVLTGGALTDRARAAGKKPKKCKVCQRRAGKTCKPKPNASPCNGTGQCFGGRCIPEPTCLGTLEGPCISVGANDLCCGGYCDIAGGMTFCTRSALNEPCRSDGDCESGVCIAYRCRNPPLMP